MGYESRIYIVEKSEKASKNQKPDKCFADIISMFDMRTYPPFKEAFSNKPDATCFIYSDDESKILFDKYGEPLKEATLDEVIDILKREIPKGEYYWREIALLSLLESIKSTLHGWDNKNIVVLHYGY